MPNPDLPAYLRLRDELIAAILDGRHPSGAALPSVRGLAASHGVNPLTVAKAYQTLQDDGVVVVRRGVGMFVAEGAAERLRHDERTTFLTETWPPIARRIRMLGLDPATLLAAERA